MQSWHFKQKHFRIQTVHATSFISSLQFLFQQSALELLIMLHNAAAFILVVVLLQALTLQDKYRIKAYQLISNMTDYYQW